MLSLRFEPTTKPFGKSITIGERITMELFFDTETSNIIPKGISYKDSNFPWVVQLGLILSDKDIHYAEVNLLIQPEGREISPGAYNAHGISTEMADKAGMPEELVITIFMELLELSDIIICHNFWFDSQMIAKMIYEHYDRQRVNEFLNLNEYCTMLHGTELCRIPKNWGTPYKWPTLQELHVKLFGETFSGAHDAMNDVRATRRCYYEMTKDKSELQKQD